MVQVKTDRWEFVPCLASNKRLDRPSKKGNQRSVGRRNFVLRSVTLFSLVGSEDPLTVLNSVLSGYGLPTVKQGVGFKTFDRIEDDFTFDYPNSWVVTRNRIRGGIYISDFKTADKIMVEVFPAEGLRIDQPAFVEEVVGRFISPGAGQQNDRLELPPKKNIRTSASNIDDLDYVYIDFPSTTITRSGYQVRRRNLAVATNRDATVYALCASVRSDQATEEKAAKLAQVVDSFRLR